MVFVSYVDKSILKTNIGLLSLSLIFIGFLAIIYFSKKNMDNVENKIYKLMIIGLLIELSSSLLSRIIQFNNPLVNPFIDFLSRIRLDVFLLFYFFINLYKIVIIKERKPDFEEKFNLNKKKIYLVLGIFFFLLFFFSFILPTTYELSKYEGIYEQGLSALEIMWMIIFMIEVFSYFIITIFSIGKIDRKKIIPFLVIDFFFFALLFDRLLYGYILATIERTIVVFVMYHTIENPDMKLVNELTLAKNQAEKSNNAKSDFLSSMSHELRTPLNAIVGLSQMIEDESSQDNVKVDAKDILVASQNLLELVDGILDINKLESNNLEVIETKYSPIEVFNDLSNMIKIRIGDKAIDLRCNYSCDLPKTLYGDKDKLRSIINNLLTNAVKYTESGFIDFNVNCTINKDICNLVITIKDTGRGISEDRIPLLFTKFNRLESDKDSDISGTGLGLAITKSLVDLLDGKIVVNSTPNVGTTFIVTFSQKLVVESQDNL
ncbi:MAG: hypothetical protein IKH54_01735 [Bacilli bacterium]|nr:hypothetical protein [Bacilli bacterium]